MARLRRTGAASDNLISEEQKGGEKGVEDHNSSTASIIGPIVKGFARFLFSQRSKRQFLARSFLEVKTAAGIPPVEVGEIPGVDVAITGTPGLLAGIAAAINARTFFEFGTFLGATSIGLARLCPDIHITTLDVPDEQAKDFAAVTSQAGIAISDSQLFKPSFKRGKLITGEAAERVTQLRKESSAFDPTPYAKSIDLIYVDASHTYSAVRSDTEKALVMLKSSGLIVWDDYSYPGVWKYVNELAESAPELQLRYLYNWNKAILMPRQLQPPNRLLKNY